jgi:hypothetical protein
MASFTGARDANAEKKRATLFNNLQRATLGGTYVMTVLDGRCRLRVGGHFNRLNTNVIHSLAEFFLKSIPQLSITR